MWTLGREEELEKSGIVRIIVKVTGNSSVKETEMVLKPPLSTGKEFENVSA